MRAMVVAGVMALAMVGQAKAGNEYPYPWLTIETGAGGDTVSLTADVDTITITNDGLDFTGSSEVDLTLTNVTSVFVEMDFGSSCEFTVGCVITRLSMPRLTAWRVISPSWAMGLHSTAAPAVGWQSRRHAKRLR